MYLNARSNPFQPNPNTQVTDELDGFNHYNSLCFWWGSLESLLSILVTGPFFLLNILGGYLTAMVSAEPLFAFWADRHAVRVVAYMSARACTHARKHTHILLAFLVTRSFVLLNILGGSLRPW